MIYLHPSDNAVSVDGRRVTLTRREYLLLETLAMMDNRLAPLDLLLDVATENYGHRVPADKDVLIQHISRIRVKTGRDFIEARPRMGYILTEKVEFR